MSDVTTDLVACDQHVTKLSGPHGNPLHPLAGFAGLQTPSERAFAGACTTVHFGPSSWGGLNRNGATTRRYSNRERDATTMSPDPAPFNDDCYRLVSQARHDALRAAARSGLALNERRFIYAKLSGNGADINALTLDEQEAFYCSLVVYGDTNYTPVWVDESTRHVKAAMEREYYRVFWGQPAQVAPTPENPSDTEDTVDNA